MFPGLRQVLYLYSVELCEVPVKRRSALGLVISTGTHASSQKPTGSDEIDFQANSDTVLVTLPTDSPGHKRCVVHQAFIKRSYSFLLAKCWSSAAAHSGSSSPQVARETYFLTSSWCESTFIIVMIRSTGLAPWEFEFHFSGRGSHSPPNFSINCSISLHSPVMVLHVVPKCSSPIPNS